MYSTYITCANVSHIQAGHGAHTCNSSTLEAEAGGLLQFQGQIGLHGMVWANQGYLAENVQRDKRKKKDFYKFHKFKLCM